MEEFLQRSLLVEKCLQDIVFLGIGKGTCKHTSIAKILCGVNFYNGCKNSRLERTFFLQELSQEGLNKGVYLFDSLRHGIYGI